MSQRVSKSIVNMKVGLLFYLLSLLINFWSRKLFLDSLGAEFMGLIGVLNNILSYLNVAELGIGTSITFFLYKPLQQDDRQQTSELVSVLAYLYRCIGLTILGFGFVVSLFFPLFFSNIGVSLYFVYFAFYTFLLSSVTGYLFNFRQLLVTADQRQYLVNAYFQSAILLQSILQIAIILLTGNAWLWASAALFCTIAVCILFNHRLNKEYPWLNVDLRQGRLLLKSHAQILQKTRQVFVQRIKDLLLYRSDDLLVAAFCGLVQSALYFNYVMVIGKVNVLVNILSNGMNAGIGNLIAEGNRQNTLKVFWELSAIRFLITGMVVFPFLIFMQPFVVCWLGKEYMLSDTILFLLLINLFLMLSRGVVEMYISACGLFHDVWAAALELVLNLGFILLLAPSLGIVGILSGKIISVAVISLLWKPYFLFRQGLHENVSAYWRGMMPYYAVFALFTLLSLVVRHFLSVDYPPTWTSLIVSAAIIVPLLVILWLLVLFFATRGMKYFIARQPRIYNFLKRNH